MQTTRALSFVLLFVSLASAHAGVIDTVAGNGKPSDVGQPFGVEMGPDGALYITEVQHHRVRRLDLRTGELTTVAGNGTKGYSGDGGPATKAQLNEPYEVRFDGDGNMFFVEMQNHLVRRVDRKSGKISTVAGTGQAGYGGDGGPATKARFKNPHSIALDDRGYLYVADIGNHRIRQIDLSSGIVKSVAGNGERKLPVDGSTAGNRPMLGPRALAIDGETMWIALREGHSVWRMNLKTLRLKHVAGSGKKGFSDGDGDLLKATFNGPKGIAVGPRGGVFVVDTENQAIRRIDVKRGRIVTIAGSGPQQRGGKGDGGRATAAQLDRPHGICVDQNGAVYIGDTLNHRVRRVVP